MHYWIYTKSYNPQNKDEMERSYYLMNSDNTNAYGISDLKHQIKQLKDMNIEIIEIWKDIKKDGTSENVTAKYIKE